MVLTQFILVGESHGKWWADEKLLITVLFVSVVAMYTGGVVCWMKPLYMSPVTTGMGYRYITLLCNQANWVNLACIPLWLLNRAVPALIGWGKGGIVISASCVYSPRSEDV